MSKGEGAKVWLIPDGYLASPPGDDKPYQSHEAICVLNTGTEESHIQLDFCFEDREPIKDAFITVGAERSFHSHPEGTVLAAIFNPTGTSSLEQFPGDSYSNIRKVSAGLRRVMGGWYRSRTHYRMGEITAAGRASPAAVRS